MTKYENLGVVYTMNDGYEILKFRKKGTKRTFFVPVTPEGKRISYTLWARRYDAITHIKNYRKYLEGKSEDEMTPTKGEAV